MIREQQITEGEKTDLVGSSASPCLSHLHFPTAVVLFDVVLFPLALLWIVMMTIRFSYSLTEVPELQDVPHPKSLAPPPYSPNAWVKLADFLARNPSWE